MNNKVNEESEVDLAQLVKSDMFEREHVMNVYDAIATHFSSTRYKAWPKVQAFIESLPKYSLVADVGCGNGKYFACAQRYRERAVLNTDDDVGVRAADEGTEDGHRYVVGVDFSAGLLQLAQQKQRKLLLGDLSDGSFACGVDLLRADGRHTALRGGIFDGAISIAVIHHFATHERRVEAVRELLRLLRPNGVVLISVWAKEQQKKRSRNDASDVFIRWEMHKLHDKEERVYKRYYHLFSKGELERLVVEAGAVVRDSYYDKENWCVIISPAQHLSS